MALAACLKYFVIPLLYIAKIYFWLAKVVYKIYTVLPINILQMIFGAGLCFFGGTYFATIAAIEAFRQFGGELLWEQLKIVWTAAGEAQIAVAADAKVDKDGNNIPDVEEMNVNDRLTHTAKVSMMAVKDPMAMQKALTFLWTTWLSVLAVLKFQFAKTVTLCLGIAEMLELPICRVLGPVIAMALGPDLNHWCFAIISITVKIIAVVIAAYVQAIISAFYSGLRGGKMFAEGFINVLAQQGIMDKCTCVAKDANGKFDPDASYLDECLAYPLAAAGFYWQFTNAFLLPFPWSIIMLPLTIVDWILKWQIFIS